jgi:hypothetical protein
MWVLLGCYGVSIFYGFIVLKLVEGAEGEFVSQSAIWTLGSVTISFEFCVSMAYWLGAFTFVALFPYMLNIIGLLKSENIIKRLAIEITKGKILNSKEDPIQPIMDIIHGSIMKYDLETARVGLKTATEQVTKIIVSKREEEISKRFCDHLERVGKLAVSKQDEESVIEVIKNLEKFGKSSAGKGLESATATAAGSLREVGTIAAEEKLEIAVSTAADSLFEIGMKSAEKGLETATQQAEMFLGEVGIFAAKKRLETAAFATAMNLGDLGSTAAEKGLKYVTSGVAMSLGFVGSTAVEKGLEDATRQAAESLAELAILNEEIVKATILDYERILEERDRDSFQKFMRIYEQELEKLRAEKRTANKKTESR